MKKFQSFRALIIIMLISLLFLAGPRDLRSEHVFLKGKEIVPSYIRIYHGRQAVLAPAVEPYIIYPAAQNTVVSSGTAAENSYPGERRTP